MKHTPLQMVLVQGECEKCEDRGETHGVHCIVRKLIFDRDYKSKPYVGRKQAMEAAVQAIETHIQKQKEKNNMTELTVQNQNVSLEQRFNYTPEQMQYIRTKVCQHATDAELTQFFYRCSVLKLDPLMPGQIYFLKFKKRNSKPGEDAYSPGSIVIGIDGFRALASRTGNLSGIKRGVIRNQKGECIGGWADVYRKDWEHPAHLEVSLKEYADPWKDTWKDMPESMIQKVAEVAALRMAFPEALGGIYSQEEMDQAKRKEREVESSFVHNQSPRVNPENRKPSDAQLKRLFTIAKTHGYTTEELKEILLTDYGHESTKDLTLDQYNELCFRMESKTFVVEKKTESDEPKYFIAPDSLPPSENFESFQNSQVSEPVAKVLTKEQELPWKKYMDQDPRMVK